MDFQNSQNYVQPPYYTPQPPVQVKKRSGGAVAANVFLYIFAVFFSMLFVLVLACKSFFTEETARAISQSLPIYSVHGDVDGESFAGILYDGLDSLSVIPLEDLDIKPTMVDHFLRESDFEGFMGDFIYDYMKAFKDGTGAIPSFEDSFFDYLSENRSLLSSNLGVDVTEQQLNDLHSELNSQFDEMDTALSGITAVTEVGAYSFFTSLISSSMLIILGVLVLVCLLLIWLSNSRRWSPLLVQTGSILMINGIVAWIITSLMEILTQAETTGFFEKLMDSMHQVMESTMIVGIVLGIAGIVCGVILGKREHRIH